MTRRTAVRSLAGLIGGATLPLGLATARLSAAENDPKPATADPATTPPPITSTPLAEDITHVSGVGGNIIVLSGDDGGLVIDCGVPDAAKGTVAEVSKAASKLTLLVNTHWHFDHAGGNAEMAKAGARIVAHENCRKRLATEQYIEALDRRLPPAPHAALSLITLTQETALHLNGEDIRLIPVAPAHTDGDVIVRFEKANLVHMGDIFFHGMYPFIDYSSRGWLGGMLQAAKTGLTLCDEKTKVVPGHGAVSGKAELEIYANLLETILARLQKLQAAGKSADEAVAAVPTKEFDEKLGGGFLNPEKFVRIAYTGLLKHGR